jgi:hypothetical protein
MANYLIDLERRGINARLLSDGTLRLEPKSAITEYIRQVVKEHREEIINELSRDNGVILVDEPTPTQELKFKDGKLAYQCPSCKAVVTLEPWPEYYNHYQAKCPCGCSKIIQEWTNFEGERQLYIYKGVNENT